MRFAGLHPEKPPLEGSALLVIGLIAVAALGAAISLWLQREEPFPGDGTERVLSPSSGMPAVAQPHRIPAQDPGV
jgi:hypothetical protein